MTAAEFLRRFVGDVPWTHLDIAGVAWDTDKPYARKGGTGYGVRLLVELAPRRSSPFHIGVTTGPRRVFTLPRMERRPCRRPAS